LSDFARREKDGARFWKIFIAAAFVRRAWLKRQR
jgi:hypothetical protein